MGFLSPLQHEDPSRGVHSGVASLVVHVPCLLLLLQVALVAPSWSTSVAPRAFPSRALPWPCLIAPPPLAATPTPQPLLPALLSHGVRLAGWSSAPSEPRAPGPTASAARKASQRRASGAAEARQRRRDKHRRRVRRHSKRSMWREILCQGPARCAMWTCCADSSSDDDDHNTSNTLLHLRADTFIPPALFAGLSDVDELMVALSCRFALDIFTFAQQDRPFPEPDLLAHDPGSGLWF